MNDKTQTPESSTDSGAGFSSTDTALPRVSEEGNPAPESDVESAASVTDPAGVEQQPEPEVVDAVEVDVVALVAKAERADEYLALAQRTQADFENYRKRAMREAAMAAERGAVKLALALLPAVDNLERALAHAPESSAEDGTGSFVAGVKHVHDDVVSALKRAGIETFSPEGETFDPQFHEAVAQQPVPGAEPGTVVEVFQRGYRLGENVLRPARVVVAG
jgi:molecular chaperone GrpE